jgi:hypothetical protein
MIILLLFLIFSWKLLYSILLSIFIEHKIANNIRCFINNLLFITLYTILSDMSIIYIPLSSYIFDTYLIYKDSKTLIRFIKEPMTIHHIIAIIIGYYIINDHLRYENLAIYYITYLSNIFIYVSYHFIKMNPEYKLLNNILLIIQTLVYSYFRIIILTLFLYNQLDTVLLLCVFDKLMLGVIYMMGIVWTCKLFYKVFGLICNVLDLIEHSRIVGEWDDRTYEK